MGTQQILLIVLSMIIVGIAVTSGIMMFNAKSVSSNRQSIIGEMNTFANSAFSFYRTPTEQGGGGNSWGSDVDDIGVWMGYRYDKPTDTITMDDGTFFLSISGTSLTILGTGTEIGTNGSSNVQVQLVADASDFSISTIVTN
ncbi:MAG: hypothetical protein K8R49_08910 [Candidatus Cloacimonetes bacterium]|nr:hypothetical protein [Candidatus Cloacimonadota bacterium]